MKANPLKRETKCGGARAGPHFIFHTVSEILQLATIFARCIFHWAVRFVWRANKMSKNARMKKKKMISKEKKPWKPVLNARSIWGDLWSALLWLESAKLNHWTKHHFIFTSDKIYSPACARKWCTQIILYHRSFCKTMCKHDEKKKKYGKIK